MESIITVTPRHHLISPLYKINQKAKPYRELRRSYAHIMSSISDPVANAANAIPLTQAERAELDREMDRLADKYSGIWQILEQHDKSGFLTRTSSAVHVSYEDKHRKARDVVIPAAHKRERMQRDQHYWYVRETVKRHQTLESKMSSQPCKFYEQYGQCKFGDQCRYLHRPEAYAAAQEKRRHVQQQREQLLSQRVNNHSNNQSHQGRPLQRSAISAAVSAQRERGSDQSSLERSSPHSSLERNSEQNLYEDDWTYASTSRHTSQASQANRRARWSESDEESENESSSDQSSEQSSEQEHDQNDEHGQEEDEDQPGDRLTYAKTLALAERTRREQLAAKQILRDAVLKQQQMGHQNESNESLGSPSPSHSLYETEWVGQGEQQQPEQQPEEVERQQEEQGENASSPRSVSAFDELPGLAYGLSHILSPKPKDTVCFFHSRGICKWGSQCLYSHDIPWKTRDGVAQQQQQIRNPRRQTEDWRVIRRQQ